MKGVSSDDLRTNRANLFPEININVYFRVYVYILCVCACVYVPWQTQFGFRFCAMIAAVAAVKRPTSTRRCTASTRPDFSRACGSCGSQDSVSVRLRVGDNALSNALSKLERSFDMHDMRDQIR